MGAHGRHQVSNCPDAALRGAEVEIELIAERRHRGQFIANQGEPQRRRFHAGACGTGEVRAYAESRRLPICLTWGYFRQRPITYNTRESSALSSNDVASGK